jgi:hypothetical protein
MLAVVVTVAWVLACRIGYGDTGEVRRWRLSRCDTRAD